jgi:hypothetical protein
VQCYTQTEIVNELTALKTLVAAGSLHLTKSNFTPAAGLTAAILDAIEADYDGYAAVNTTAVLDIYSQGNNSWAFQVATIQFNYGPAAVPPVTNMIYGFYVKSAAGDVIYSATLPSPFPMVDTLSGLPIDLLFSRSANPF